MIGIGDNLETLMPNEVLTTYDCIVDLVNTLHISLPLFQRPKDKIKKVLHHIAFKWNVP